MSMEDIPAFVDSVIATGCDIRAIGQRRYIIGDLDLGDEQRERAAPMLAEINRTFGDRDFLINEICQYLHSIGRGYECEADYLVNVLWRAQHLVADCDDPYLRNLVDLALARAKQRNDGSTSD